MNVSLWEIRRRFLNGKRKEFPLAAPLITGDDFRSLCDFVFDDQGLTFLPSQVFENAIIFVKAYPPLLDYFFRQIHPRIRHPYRLLTHNDDRSMPGQHEAFLREGKLRHWYSTNISCRHPKLTSIPIGILNRRANPDSSKRLGQLIQHPGSAKQSAAYMNFHVGPAGTGYGDRRQAIYDRFRSCDWVHVASKVSPQCYLEGIASHRFVISPPGHGPDCYRHWEAMYLGSIPVVESCVNMECYADFPMILIDDWQQVTPQYLNDAAAEIETRLFDRSRLFFEHWKNLISSCQQRARD